METPIFSRIYGDRWAAHGKCWTVHGDTKEEAERLFREAEERHVILDARAREREEQEATSPPPP